MSKKNFPTRIDPINLPRRLREGLAEAEDLLDNNEPREALELLQELDKKFPRQLDVLGLMGNAYTDLQDTHGYFHTMFKLHNLIPNRADVKLGLAGAYLFTGRLALALQTFRQFLKQWPRHEGAADAQKMIPELEQALSELLPEFGLTLETGFDFACKHEELQVLMEIGQYERCKQLAKNLLAQRPDFIPVINNLCLVYWLEGVLPAAIEIGQKALALQPDNIHALSNLTRFLFMQGKTEDALALAARLKESTAEAADLWTKKIEALSFIADDEGVLSMLEQARKAKDQDQLNAYVWHWCAVAEYRRGNIAKARSYWQKSQKASPSFGLAGDNLAELKKPVHERVSPQVFPMDAWLSRKVIEGLSTTVQRASARKSDQVFREKTCAYFDEHPEILGFVAAALPWGDSEARELAGQLVAMSAHPKLVPILRDFALGEVGPDAQRIEASQTLSKLGVLESGQNVDLWLEGEWKPIMMIGFQISYDSEEKPTLKPATLRLMEQAVNALHEEEYSKAEGLLRKALEIQPNEPSLLNNLAFALGRQDKTDESETLAERIAHDFPDYFFGQIIAVRRAIQADDFEKAKEIVNKLMKKKELHVTEFSALCACQIDLMIQDEKPEGAVSWFEMWKQGYPEDPALEKYEHTIAMIEVFSKLKNGFPRSRRKIKRP
jgi:tetratricopeptide (TPR) repeat protein